VLRPRSHRRLERGLPGGQALGRRSASGGDVARHGLDRGDWVLTVVDQAAIDRLLDMTGGDPEFLRELITTYVEDGAAQLVAMRDAVSRGDAEALVRTLATAGRTAAFSGVIVAAALASLLVYPQPFLYSMGVGGIFVALAWGLGSYVTRASWTACNGTATAFSGSPVNRTAPSRRISKRRPWKSYVPRIVFTAPATSA
jgi:hypothetical protein